MKNRRTLVFTSVLAIVLAGFVACEGLERPTGTQTEMSIRDLDAHLKISAATKKGGRIAFVSLRDGNHEIYVMNADGTGQTRLTNNPAFDSEPVWSPNGKQIAFVSTRNGSPEIYVMNADGTDVTLLTNNLAINFQPAWSPNGKQIAFTSDRDGNNQARLTDTPAIDAQPVWSPNGKQIIFRSNRDGNGEIYRMNADGTAQTNLTDHPDADRDPAWRRQPGSKKRSLNERKER